MSYFDSYINLDNTEISRTRLYADSLPGIDVETIDGLRKSGNNTNETWDLLYRRACDNLVSDVSKNVQDKFFVDLKLVSRETSAFLETYSSGNAGVKISMELSKYSKIHILSVALWAQANYSDVPIRFYDTDADGELLLTVTQDVVAGRNTINVDTDFEVDELFISIDGAAYHVRQTENKYYAGMTYDFLRTVVCFECYGGSGSVEQINGGGLNVKYVAYCSVDKFVGENLNLFKQALLWKIGVEITDERRYGERLNRFTTMTVERATELGDFYTGKYEMEIMNAIKSQNIREDAICFNCKNTVTVQTSLP